MKKIVTVLIFSLMCLLTASLNAQKCRITCPDCGGKGYISAGSIHGQPAAYGCTRCGGFRGDPFNGPPGSPGTGYILVPCPDNKTKPPPNQPSDADRKKALEDQRKKEAEEQQKRDAEEAQRKQIDFEKSKQDALKNMKGIEENELGLKGIDNGEPELKGVDGAPANSGLKGVTSRKSPDQLKPCDCEWGNLDPSVVDLRCLGLDPNKPITLDPVVVKGKERNVPVQPDPNTFKNISYNKGFEALARPDVASAAAAVTYFEQALKERPSDPLVRNALGLAQDILRARKQKVGSNKARAAELTRETYAALMNDQMGSARAFITRAGDLDPNNIAIHFLGSTLAVIGPASVTSATPEERAGYKLVGNSLLFIAKENYPGAKAMLEVASKMVPGDPFITRLLLIIDNYDAGRRSNPGK